MLSSRPRGRPRPADRPEHNRARATSPAVCPPGAGVCSRGGGVVPCQGMVEKSISWQRGRHMETIGVITFDGPGAPPRLRQVPRPEVPEKAALIRIDACGVCGTDLHILK